MLHVTYLISWCCMFCCCFACFCVHVHVFIAYHDANETNYTMLIDGRPTLPMKRFPLVEPGFGLISWHVSWGVLRQKDPAHHEWAESNILLFSGPRWRAQVRSKSLSSQHAPMFGKLSPRQPEKRKKQIWGISWSNVKSREKTELTRMSLIWSKTEKSDRSDDSDLNDPVFSHLPWKTSQNRTESVAWTSSEREKSRRGILRIPAGQRDWIDE